MELGRGELSHRVPRNLNVGDASLGEQGPPSHDVAPSTREVYCSDKRTRWLLRILCFSRSTAMVLNGKFGGLLC